MRFPVRHRWTMLVVVSFGAFPALSASPEWATDTIEEMWEYTASEKIIRSEASRKLELQSESDFVLQRIRVKESILDEIEMGRTSLLDAANRFRTMDADRPGIVALSYPPQRLGSAEEIAAQAVIRHLRTRFQSGRPLAANTMARTIAEFERTYGYDPMKNESE